MNAEKIIVSMGVVILLLSGVIAWLLFKPQPKPGTVTVVTIDTQWIAQAPDTQYLQAPAKQGEVAQPVPPQYLPSPDCDSLKKQYNHLAQNYFAKRWYTRTLAKDSIKITITDTVQGNALLGGMAVWDVKYPQVNRTETTTITLPPRRQVFAGGGIGATFKGTGWYGRAGLLLKNKRENIIGASLWGNNQLQYGAEVQTYWIIK